jgi:hypothetical protein
VLFDKSGMITSSGTCSGVGSGSGSSASYVTRGPLFTNMQLETAKRMQISDNLKLIFDILQKCLCVLIKLKLI